MKKIISLVLAMLLAFSLFACANGATTSTGTAQPEETKAAEVAATTKTPGGELKVVATSKDYVDLFAKFEKETGIKSEILSMSSGDVLSKLRAEGGTPGADVWFGGGIDAFMAAKEDGLLEKVDFEASKLLDPQFKDFDNYYFSKGITVVGFLFNDDLMKEKKFEYPKTWDDLLKPEYKGEIIMSNPAISGTNYAVVNALLQTKKDGWDFLTKLNDNIAYYGKRGSDPKNKVMAGEYPIGITYLDGTIEAILKENNLSTVYPEDGVPWVPEGVAVFKNSANVDNAKLFIEWLYSNDDNLRYLAEIDKKTGVKVIKPSIEGLTLSFDPKKLMAEDLTLFGSMRKEILDRFEPMMGDKAAKD